ncbi:MAG: hypothetical protein K2R98_06865 [Gemmataceae bacterium]|nr:hypothetical protein [Gemmataceae bacterium]
MSTLATHDFSSLDPAVEFLKRTRAELRMLRKVRIWKDRLHVYDINGDCFEVRGVGYLDPDIVPLLKHLNTNYNPDTIHAPTDDEYKEFKTGRRYPWAQDRVM